MGKKSSYLTPKDKVYKQLNDAGDYHEKKDREKKKEKEKKDKKSSRRPSPITGV